MGKAIAKCTSTEDDGDMKKGISRSKIGGDI